MALPKLNAPTYQITIPSTGVTTQYRPFLNQGTKTFDDGKNQKI